MPKFSVYGKASVTLWTEVEAANEEEARNIVADFGVPRPSSQAYMTGDDDTWSVDAELSEPSVTDIVAHV